MDNKIANQAAETWQKVMSFLEQELSSVSIDRWFRNLYPSHVSDNTLVIDVPDEFFKSWIEDHYLELIYSALKRAQVPVHTIEFKLSPRVLNAPRTPAASPVHSSSSSVVPASAAVRREGGPMNPQYSFEEFVVGPSNRFAHAACLAVSDQPAKAYNPLFIYGPVGMGKTHLMQAIGHQCLKRNPDAVILYITSEKFTNQLISAIQNQTTSAFRQKYRTVDVLLIDDIHFIAGKEATQEEFFHTFNALYDEHKQIVVSSDRPPKEIKNLEERLISRFEWGLVTDIQKPDFETRSAILRKKAQRHNIPVPDEVTNFIAEVVQANIRELEGSLMRVVAYAQLTGQPVTVELAAEVLKKTIQESEKKITVDLIQHKVSSYFAIKNSEMMAKRRSKNVVLPRQIAMFLTRELTDFSLPEIGESFGGRDHTTVLHACEKIKKVIEKDGSVRDMIARIRQEIRN